MYLKKISLLRERMTDFDLQTVPEGMGPVRPA